MVHLHIVAIEPPGTTNRKWQCKHCGSIGLLFDLKDEHCNSPIQINDDNIIDNIIGD